ncbi:VOC family protein [uncultured Psychrobacillus sp.]|uniref:VOC family protein n=1 Tax=uncultured Psychrobacillus sp. TaxID=1551585 RepID=UPI002637DBDC|nr:VOC family protein [uncultured Psychrobacillus sp.]
MNHWQNSIAQIRIARPTDKLSQVVDFYHKGLGLKIIGSFKDHDGYNGVMIGLPNKLYHLEFTAHKDGSPCPSPSKDNLLVFYIPQKLVLDTLVNQLIDMGYLTVSSENPYWEKNGVTFEDPDGWRVVLMNDSGI